MHTFCDLLDTATENTIFLQITPIHTNGFPDIWVSINDTPVYQGLLQSTLCVERSFALTSRLKVAVGLQNKQYSEHLETAVVIDSLRINAFELVPQWTHLASYINERDINDPVSYLGFNGVWCLETDDCFHRWWHRSTGQGWLLEPITKARDLVPSSTSTRDSLTHSDAGSIAVDKDPTRVGGSGPVVP